jgi:superfamily II DNA or RNA helicase
MILRGYQEDLIEGARVALKTYRSVLLQSPTGSGKTALTVRMMSNAADRNLSSMFMVHQKELLKQTSKALWKQKLQHGLIASGKSQSLMPAQVAMGQTLVRRLDRYEEPRLIIIDEAHRAAASTYLKIIERYPNAKIIGLTATPERTDGKGLGSIFETIVTGPSVRQLIDAGYLCDYEIMAPPTSINLEGMKVSLGDYDTAEAEAEIDKPSITGDAVEHYIKYASGKRCVVMCVSVSHARHVADQYRATGIQAEAIYGGMDDSERESALERFSRGETKVITNVQLLIEGVDIPSIEVVQWLRPTQSLIVWLQGNGRGLRPAEGKEFLLILDHVGNWKKHGLIDEDRIWTLDGRKPKARRLEMEAVENISTQRCDKCHHLFRTGPDHCPMCGAEVAQYKPKDIQILEGELEKINLEKERVERKKEKGTTRDLRDLIELGLRRGLKKPAAWAAHTIASRKGNKAGKEDFEEAEKMLKDIKRGEKPAWPE